MPKQNAVEEFEIIIILNSLETKIINYFYWSIYENQENTHWKISTYF